MRFGGAPRRRSRSVTRGAALLSALVGGGLLAGCGNPGLTLAQQACGHVKASISLYEKSTKASDPSTAAALAAQAGKELNLALPLASQAAYHDGQWQPLMFTISEQGRVPESVLVSALTEQCQATVENALGQAVPGALTTPSSTPPAPSGLGSVPTTTQPG